MIPWDTIATSAASGTIATGLMMLSSWGKSKDEVRVAKAKEDQAKAETEEKIQARFLQLETKCTELENRLEEQRLEKDKELTALREQITALRLVTPCSPPSCPRLAERNAKVAELEAKLQLWESQHFPPAVS